MARAARLHYLNAVLRAGRFPTPNDVMAAFGVSRRSVFDDVRYLREQINAPIIWDRSRGGWAYSDPTFDLPALILTDDETATLHRALLAAREHLDAGAQTGLDVFAAWLERSGASPPAVAAESAGGGSHLSGGVTVPAELIAACQRAVRNRRKLFFRYHGAHRGEATERTIQPHHLHHWRGEPYLLAWDELRNDWRTFFLGRVQDWRDVGEDAAFARRPGFDARALLAKGFELLHGAELVTVRARFSPYQARWVRERRYHPSQENEEHPDGSLVLTLHVAGTQEIKRWLLSHGAEVEVLEPATLRAELAAEAKKLAKIYCE